MLVSGVHKNDSVMHILHIHSFKGSFNIGYNRRFGVESLCCGVDPC